MSEMKILGLSDVEMPEVYSLNIRERFKDIDLVISSGDLPYYYLEYVISMLDIQLYYVQGNHVLSVEEPDGEIRQHPWGAVDLHKKVIYDEKHDLILAGIEGSLRYNRGKYQYTEREMWGMVLGMVPAFIYNRIRYGRYLDIFVTHAAAFGHQDDTDRAHVGSRAFRWLVRTFQPRLHIHGHLHRYNTLTPREIQIGRTRVINTYGFTVITLENLKR